MVDVVHVSGLGDEGGVADTLLSERALEDLHGEDGEDRQAEHGQQRHLEQHAQRPQHGVHDGPQTWQQPE